MNMLLVKALISVLKKSFFSLDTYLIYLKRNRNKEKITNATDFQTSMGHDKVFIKVAVNTHPTVSPEWSLQKKEDCKH